MKKNYTFDTHRVKAPQDTVREVLSRLKTTWIWDEENIKLYPIWDLDIFKEYVYCIFSNVGKRNNWGKWLTKYQAIASALMEFCERYSWYKMIEKVNNELPCCLYKDIPDPKISLEKMILTRGDKKRVAEGVFYDRMEFPFIQAYSLSEKVHKYIPWYEPEFLTTNCLWAGNTLSEAILHAIYETIERHIYNIMMVNLEAPKVIDITTITHPAINELISKIQSLGFEMYILDCSFFFETHTIGAIVYNEQYQFVGHYAMNFHMGTHSNKDIAILRALTEITQNRATNYDNNKTSFWDLWDKNFFPEKDLSPITSHYLSLLRTWGFQKISYQEIPNYIFDDIDEELDFMVKHLTKNGYEILLIDITDARLQIPCVRVLIPGLQPMIFELFDDASWPWVRVSNFLHIS